MTERAAGRTVVATGGPRKAPGADGVATGAGRSAPAPARDGARVGASARAGGGGAGGSGGGEGGSGAGEPGPSTPSRNEVLLVGRVSGAASQRELPSGDVLAAFRIVVDRPLDGRKPPAGVRPTTVDTLDCTAWTPGLRRTVLGLVDGDVVEVTGALRRRFWRAGAAAASRTEVEVSAARRLRRG